MYWFWRSKHTGCCIRAYDFDQMKLFKGAIKSFEHETLIWNAKTYLLHMGGDTFCLLWRSPAISQTKTQYHCTQLHVFKEEVSEEGSRGVLNARVLAYQSFITPGKHRYVKLRHCTYVHYCFIFSDFLLFAGTLI